MSDTGHVLESGGDDKRSGVSDSGELRFKEDLRESDDAESVSDETFHSGYRPQGRTSSSDSDSDSDYHPSGQKPKKRKTHTLRGRKGNCKRAKQEDLNVKSGEATYMCGVCNKTAFSSSALMLHMTSHTDMALFEYKEFDKVYITQSQCMDHWKQEHSQTEADYTRNGEKCSSTKMEHFLCDVCRKIFILESELMKHKRIHSGNQQHVCKHCGKVFKDKSNMRRHQNRHEEGAMSRENIIFIREPKYL